jgi:hypothetical protein
LLNIVEFFLGQFSILWQGHIHIDPEGQVQLKLWILKNDIFMLKFLLILKNDIFMLKFLLIFYLIFDQLINLNMINYYNSITNPHQNPTSYILISIITRFTLNQMRKWNRKHHIVIASLNSLLIQNKRTWCREGISCSEPGPSWGWSW